MINLKYFIESIAITWIRRIFHSENVSWWRLLLSQFPNLPTLFADFGPEFISNNIIKKSKNQFWNQVFIAFQHLMILSQKYSNSLQVPLWYNRDVKIGGKIVFLRQWYKKGIIYISDLFNEEGEILNYEEFCLKFDFRPPCLIFFGIVRNIRRLRFETPHRTTFRPFKPLVLEILLKHKKGCRNIYDFLLSELKERPSNEIKWQNELLFERNTDWWVKANRSVFLLKDIKLSWLQYRVLHRILGTKYLLYKMNLATDNLCTFCSTHVENVYHLFWGCHFVSPIWKDLADWLNRTLDNVNFDFSLDEVLFFHHHNIVNRLLCVVKSYIFSQKNKNIIPNINGAKIEIQYYIKLQQKLHDLKENRDVFEKKWKAFISLLD